MKKHNLIFVLMISLGCDTKETKFNGALAGEFLSEKIVYKTTGKSQTLEQRLVIRDTLFLYKKGENGIILTNLKTVYRNAREGTEIIQGYDFATKTNRSIRLIYVDWWNNPSSKVVVTSPLMTGDYQEKNDTVDVYYNRLR